MNGWYTKHQEFTLAKGDPTLITSLIQQFKLNGIVSFDETNKLITTTIKHDDYIRLSDLLLLNYSQVIVFTVEQLIDVMRQLFGLLQEMKINHIQHGNLTTENILLDLTLSDHKLENQSNMIIFKLKLINCAQFYNLQIVDDFERTFAIYTYIAQLFPQYQLKVEDFQSKVLQINDSYSQALIDTILSFGISVYQNLAYHWDSNFISALLQTQNAQIPTLSNFPSIDDLIQQLFQYHLITHHYKQMVYSELDPQTPFNYLKQNKNIIDTCSFLDQIFDLNQLLNIDIDDLEEVEMEKSLNKTIIIYRKQIQQELIIFLKQCGYFQNIEQFGQIIQNIDQVNNFTKNQFVRAIIKNSEYTNNILELPKEFLSSFAQSSMMITNLGLKDIFKFEIDNRSQQFNEQVAYFKSIRMVLIESFNFIKRIGQKYSQPLIDHFINRLKKELKNLNPLNRELLIQFMVDNWLRWIDQQIYDQKISTLEQFQQINKQTFIQFIEEIGYLLFQEEMKKQITKIVERIFENGNI